MSKGTLSALLSRFAAAIVVAVAAVAVVVPPSGASASGGIAGSIAGLYEIKNVKSELCLTVNGGYSHKVEPMIQYSCRGWAYQKFQFRYTNNPDFFLIHPKAEPDMCLGMAVEGTQANGVGLEQQYCPHDAYGNIIVVPQQMFSLQQVAVIAGGNVRVKLHSFTSPCLQVNGASKINYATISQWDCSPPGNIDTLHYYWDFRWLAHS